MVFRGTDIVQGSADICNFKSQHECTRPRTIIKTATFYQDMHTKLSLANLHKDADGTEDALKGHKHRAHFSCSNTLEIPLGSTNSSLARMNIFDNTLEGA